MLYVWPQFAFKRVNYFSKELFWPVMLASTNQASLSSPRRTGPIFQAKVSYYSYSTITFLHDVGWLVHC